MRNTSEELKHLAHSNREINEAMKHVVKALDHIGQMPSYYDKEDPNHIETVAKYNSLTTIYIKLSNALV